MRTRLTLAGALLLAGCSSYSKAERLEKKGELAEAAAAYASAARGKPSAPWAAEALFKSAKLFKSLGQCREAVGALEDLARNYPEPWPEAAKAAILECPDYLPIAPGWAWVFGDSETRGSNMRQEARIAEKAEAGGVLEVKTFAGEKLFSTFKRELRKRDWRIEEFDDKTSTVVLRWPFRRGNEWNSPRGGRNVTFSIDEDAAVVEVKAGRFSNCLKVREQIEGIPSWSYVYYAPGIGRVLTSAGGKGFETRNAELLSYVKP